MRALVSSLIAFTLVIACLQVNAQTFTPPAKVAEGFSRKYLGESMVYEWRPLEVAYIATFTHQNKYKYVLVDSEGKWLEEGEAIDRTTIPENIYQSLPELDVTAFVHESFRAITIQDDKGYLLIYETDVERIEFWVTDQGKILRKNHYDIPPAPEEKKIEEQGDDIDWGDGR